MPYSCQNHFQEGFKFINFNSWTPSISLLLVDIYVVSTNSGPFRRLFPSQPLLVNNFPKNYVRWCQWFIDPIRKARKSNH